VCGVELAAHGPDGALIDAKHPRHRLRSLDPTARCASVSTLPLPLSYGPAKKPCQSGLCRFEIHLPRRLLVKSGPVPRSAIEGGPSLESLLSGLSSGRFQSRHVIDQDETRDLHTRKLKHRVTMFLAEDRHQDVEDSDFVPAFGLRVEYGAL
jgi:hypothetical protein